MKYKSLFFKAFIAFLFLFNCDSIKNDPEENFIIEDYSNYGDLGLAFWKIVNDNYSFFPEDGIRKWIEAYEYVARLREISTGLSADGRQGSLNGGNLDKVIELFKKMTRGLIDGHFYLKRIGSKDVNFNPLRERKGLANGFNISSSLSNVSERRDFQQISKISNSYNDDDCMQADEKEREKCKEENQYKKIGLLLGELKQNKGGDIIYLGFDYFFLRQGYEKKGELYKTLNTFFEMTKNINKKYKGVVIDVRNNNGGRVRDLFFFISRFIQEEIVFGKSRVKKGPHPLEHNPWADEKLSPHPDKISPDLEVALLINGNSISLAEIMAVVFSKANHIIVGEQTRGAYAPVMEDGHNKEMNMGGEYDLGNRENGVFINFSMSIAALKVFDHEVEDYVFNEGTKGVKPHIETKDDKDQVDKAIAEINKRSKVRRAKL